MLGLYVHIPYCSKKCNYCDFVSYELGESSVAPEEYVAALKKEIDLRAGVLPEEYHKIDTIYIGGGTPTCLRVELLQEILRCLHSQFFISPGAEITVEVNPGAITTFTARILREAGVNRISLGAQAFQEELLKSMGRSHMLEDIYTAFKACCCAGISNLNLDLIYGLPGQSRKQWEYSLEQVIRLGAEHVSVYGLHLDPATPWGKSLEKGNLSLPGEELERQMYMVTMEKLSRNGYVQYEISNFSLPEKRCQHNRIYWLNEEYIGLGVAASSHLQSRRLCNSFSVENYRNTLNANTFPIVEDIAPDQEREMSETVFLNLRMVQGLNLEYFYERFGLRAETIYSNPIEKLTAWGYLAKQGSYLKLTCKALPVANLVFAEFV